MDGQLERIVEILDSEPLKQCVLRRQFLDDLGIEAANLGIASRRKFHDAVEITGDSKRNMAFRDRVVVFAPKESA